MHAACDDAFHRAFEGISRRSQQRQFVAEFVEQTGEAPNRRVISRACVYLVAIGFHDQIDRAVLQMQPLVISEPGDLRLPIHGRDPGADPELDAATWRISPAFSEASGRT